MTDIFTRIKQDHDTARDLMQQIKDTTDRAAKTRAELFEAFKLDLWAHHKIEEATFYTKLETKGERDESLEAKNEHHMVNSMLEELDTMAKDTQEWGQKFHAMCELIEHHMDEEEEGGVEHQEERLGGGCCVCLLSALAWWLGAAAAGADGGGRHRRGRRGGRGPVQGEPVCVYGAALCK